MEELLRIAVQIELSRAHGRALLKGFSEIASDERQWRPRLVDAADLRDRKRLDEFDAFAVRIMDDPTARALQRTGRPVVDLYGRCSNGCFPIVNIDDSLVANAADDCFREHSFTNCAYLGFPGLRFSDERGAAFARLVTGRGGTCDLYTGKAVISDSYFQSEKPGRIPDLRQLMKWVRHLKKPVAVFCCNDLRAFQLTEAVARCGFSIPRDIAIIGVDNDMAICSFASPPLSSIDTDAEHIGSSAAKMLRAMLAGHDPASGIHPPSKYRVVERTSTDTYPFATTWVSDALVYIRRNLANNVNAKKVFAHLGYSHTTVENAFKAELGHGVGEEITAQRISLACRLLKESDLSAVQIARSCGYASAQYFTRAFAAETGLSPSVWRKANAERVTSRRG